jgi:predicted nuclease of predicted toxin-antitoxin system
VTFLLDEQLPASLTQFFEHRGQRAVHVKSIGLTTAPDASVWTHAQANGWVVVTKDADFSVLLRHRPGARALWLQCGNCSNRELERFLASRWHAVVVWLGTGSPLLTLDGGS